jgi:hypothetical protein
MGLKILAPVEQLDFQSSGFTAITHSGNTHTIDLDAVTNNYTISFQNATNTIAFTNLDASHIGKSGTIVCTNPGTVNSLAFANTFATDNSGAVLIPGGGTIAFKTSANAVALISYYVISATRIVINYVSGYDTYNSYSP